MWLKLDEDISEEVFGELARLANFLKVKTVTEHHGVRAMASPGDTEEDVKERWRRSVELRAKALRRRAECGK